MRLAVLSDIHGNLTALDAVLADLDAAGGAETLWMLGDVVAFGPRPAECVQRVRALVERLGKDNVRCIRGNTDRYVIKGERPPRPSAKDAEALETLKRDLLMHDGAFNWALSRLGYEEYEFLRDMGYELGLNAPGYGYVIGYHGTPGNDEGMLTPDMPADQARDALLDREGRLAIGGHIHVQMDRDIGGWRAINVGSIGMSIDQPGYAEWGLFTFENGNVTVDLRAVPFDKSAVAADFAAVGHFDPAWGITRLRLK